MGEREGLASRLTVEKLPNGLTLLNDYVPNQPRSIVSVTILRGKWAERSEWSGVHHCLEHLMTRGSKKFPTEDDIKRECHRLVSERLEAETSREYIRIGMNLSAEHVIAGTELIHDVIRWPRFRARDFAAEKGAIKKEISEDHDKVEDWLDDFMPMVAWGSEHPMGRPILGTSDAISTLTLDDLKSAHKRHVVGSAMVLTISGSNPLDLKTATQIFEDVPEIPRGRQPKPCAAPRWSDGIPSHFDLRTGNTSCYWSLILPGVRSGSPRCLAIEATTEILEDRLMAIVRARDGNAYDIRTSLHPFAGSGIIDIRSAQTGEDGPVKAITVERVMTKAIRELLRLAKKGPTKAEMTDFQGEEYARLHTQLANLVDRHDHFADQMVYRNEPIAPEESARQVKDLTFDQVRSEARLLASKLPRLRLLAVAPKHIEDRLLTSAKNSAAELSA